MRVKSDQKITHQAAGAFGEKAVEAELLRHNWIPANINQTVKNAADFDIRHICQERGAFGANPGQNV
jgi:hypothetical protein